jgi:hypothetical protein
MSVDIPVRPHPAAAVLSLTSEQRHKYLLLSLWRQYSLEQASLFAAGATIPELGETKCPLGCLLDTEAAWEAPEEDSDQ